mmetsp:Transcript_8203/g.11828  ORF Transcript_8203/g.11828 Transcript_8203/m.11828 type:complete len:170 (-) Transcript_8203:51-560(-)
MRDAVLNILRTKKAEKHNDTQPWEQEDFCVSWFETGNVTGVDYDPRMELHEFSRFKYALEMKGLNSTWFRIWNDMDNDAEVILNYMSMGPDSTVYPTVNVSLSTSDQPPVTIDAFEYSPAYSFPIHIVQQKKIGTIPSGETTLFIEKVKENIHPFRIVGIIVTPPTGLD